MMRKKTMLLFVAATLGACVKAQDALTVDPARPRQQVMRDEALTTLLSNVVISPVGIPGATSSHPHAEMFSAGGAYLRTVGRARFHGRFDVQNDTVCVRAVGITPACRTITDLNNGTYAMIDLATGAITIVTSRPF